MSLQLCTYELISFMLISVQYLQVTISETDRDTWKNAVLNCNKKNAYLESNETVLKNYMANHNGITKLWVGKFQAFLPWIEIRGCYKIPQICNHKERDEKMAKTSALCQLKCMNRQYFAFNPKNDRCVCFDEHGIVMKESKNASLCQTCGDQADCNSYAVAYKVLNRYISDASNELACLSYRCISTKKMPIFKESDCFQLYCKPYCRNLQRAIINRDLPFFEYIKSCQRDHFSYPLLQSENFATLCNIPEAEGTNIWVGVYRQEISADLSEKTEKQDFNQPMKYISKCHYLSTNGALEKTKNCTDGLTTYHYICTPETSRNFQGDPNNISTSTPACRSADPGIPETDKQSSGLIAGTVTSIMVILIVIVIIVFIYRKRFNSKTQQLQDNHNDGNPSKNNACAHERNSDGQYHETDVTLGPYSFAKPLADTNVRSKKAVEDENEYSRIVSVVFDASNRTEKTNNCIANPGYNDVQINNNKKFPIGYQQHSNSLTGELRSGDYNLAKPISNPCEMDPYTDNADYDHLSNVKNREVNTVKVYDHVPNIIDADVTYDHSTINICKSESDNYDHFEVQN